MFDCNPYKTNRSSMSVIIFSVYTVHVTKGTGSSDNTIGIRMRIMAPVRFIHCTSGPSERSFKWCGPIARIFRGVWQVGGVYTRSRVIYTSYVIDRSLLLLCILIMWNVCSIARYG